MMSDATPRLHRSYRIIFSILNPEIGTMRFVCLLAALLTWPVFDDECFWLVDADDVTWFDCRE